MQLQISVLRQAWEFSGSDLASPQDNGFDRPKSISLQ
jgi:hypothetical protein